MLRILPRFHEILIVYLENLIESLPIYDIHAHIVREEARRCKAGGDDYIAIWQIKYIFSLRYRVILFQ